MPIYEYECEDCNSLQEEFIITSSDKDKTITCNICGNPISRIMSKNTFVLKGMCWEKDGYCGKSEAKGY